MTARADQIAGFLHRVGWQMAKSQPLVGDASARRYFRLTLGNSTAILMDSPLGGVDDPAQFVAIAEHLLALGLSPPRCMAQELELGLLLLEDLGDDVLARVVARAPERELPLYKQAVDVLLHIQRHPVPAGLPNFSADDWADAAMMAPKFYSHAITGQPQDYEPLRRALADALGRWANGPRVMILRDYHAENLMLLPNRQGLAQIGLLDFQLAQMGQPAYDLISLLQDARRDVAPETQSALIRHWCDQTGQSEADFSASYAAFGVQRALRIVGNFARLCTQQGKPDYLAYLPRVWRQLHQNLSHPYLADLAKSCGKFLPPPTDAALASLRSQCKNPHP